jgi:hypothetical protein
MTPTTDFDCEEFLELMKYDSAIKMAIATGRNASVKVGGYHCTVFPDGSIWQAFTECDCVDAENCAGAV